MTHDSTLEKPPAALSFFATRQLTMRSVLVKYEVNDKKAPAVVSGVRKEQAGRMKPSE